MSLAIISAVMADRIRRDGAPEEALVSRFATDCRPAISRLCARDFRFGELAATFPALLHRIAIRRDAAAAAVILAGGSLKRAAAASGLPTWTRRLPPEAFGRTSYDLPGGAAFARRIANVLPCGRKSARGGLECVAEAARWGEEDFVIWTAREARRSPTALPRERIKLMAFHAFFSRRPDVLGGALHAERWSPALHAPAALKRALGWHEALDVAVRLGRREIDVWFEPGEIDGFEFLPVTTSEALIEEALAMDNCVRDYAGEIASDHERIWSIRRGGVRVATLSVYFGEAPFPLISQLKGPKNKPAADAVWFATRKWLEAQGDVPKRMVDWDRPLDREIWVEVWKPYWLARGRAPAGVALTPSDGALSDIRGLWRRRRRVHRRG